MGSSVGAMRKQWSYTQLIPWILAEDEPNIYFSISMQEVLEEVSCTRKNQRTPYEDCWN
ncbi:hypothetical protein QBE53_13065 [Vallitaleaceae bacterium 9-2]